MANFANPELDNYFRRIILPSGTSTSPSIVFANDLTQGFYYDVDAGVIKSVGFDGDGGITELTGDITAGPGSGSQAATLATVNPDVGSFTSANITVDAKGRITAAANGSSGSGITQLTGDVSAGPGSGSVSSSVNSLNNGAITVDSNGIEITPGQAYWFDQPGSHAITLDLGINAINIYSPDGVNIRHTVGGSKILESTSTQVTSTVNINPTSDNTIQLGVEATRYSVIWGLVYGLKNANPINFISSDSGNTLLRVDGTVAAGETGMWLWDQDSGALQRVTVGAADSGGTGFKVLRIPN